LSSSQSNIFIGAKPALVYEFNQDYSNQRPKAILGRLNELKLQENILMPKTRVVGTVFLLFK
jgi:hypothetical protein